MKKMILTVELIPQTCWFSNVRTNVSKAEWDFIRKQVYSAAYDTCEICGGIGPNHPVECHEVWQYDDEKLTQTLIRMIALCPDCHSVKHFGLAFIRNKGEVALKHLINVNKINRSKAEAYVNRAMKLWVKRSKFQWTLDISILSDYGIDIEKFSKKDI